ncbi:MAG: hypothetical protein CL877_00300 [Dehalococcoidales bacterium]|jgi:hypothetical protein|uniref:Uncharacterized protein n=1 Tax=marine metagenome TaxID=408172 RepID=A0A382VX12_9ZZZZ|nr:hypothetical protein [Dehalococcoidales bacterium]
MTDNGDPDAITLNGDRLAAICTYESCIASWCFLATTGMFINDGCHSRGKSIEKSLKMGGY